MIQALDSHKDINVALHNVLRWGGILLVENSTACSGATYEQLATHPGVVFLASDRPEEVPETFFLAIDAVIDCNTTTGGSRSDKHANCCALWYQYLADKLPQLFISTSVERLQKIVDILASVESRETRMAKTLLTAKRLAQSSAEAVQEDHIFEVIRQSIAQKDLSKFESQLETLK